MTTETQERPTAVYRFYDADVRLLYVGITYDLGGRFREHERGAAWWKHQRSALIMWRPTRAEALAEELDAVQHEKPLWNVSGTSAMPRPPRRSRAKADAPRRRKEPARPSNLYRLVEGILGTPLADYVSARRATDSWRTMARDLTERTGQNVTHETLRGWFAGRIKETVTVTDRPAVTA
jgi:hypothetical protein